MPDDQPVGQEVGGVRQSGALGFTQVAGPQLAEVVTFRDHTTTNCFNHAGRGMPAVHGRGLGR